MPGSLQTDFARTGGAGPPTFDSGRTHFAPLPGALRHRTLVHALRRGSRAFSHIPSSAEWRSPVAAAICSRSRVASPVTSRPVAGVGDLDMRGFLRGQVPMVHLHRCDHHQPLRYGKAVASVACAQTPAVSVASILHRPCVET